MKANELRIGNYIDRNGLMVIVTINDRNQVKFFDTINMMRTKWFSVDRACKGISLTEEWLKRFGFVRENEWVGFIGNYRIGIRFNDGNSAECDIIQDGKFISFGNSHIKYVHQLQNLYFVLTGDELEIVDKS